MNIILCPVDFSENAENALDYAAKFALALKTKLVLFNAYSVPALYTDAPMPEIFIYDKQRYIKQQLENLKTDVQKKYGLKNITCVSRMGGIVSEILNYSKEIKADWIVMGARGMSKFKRIVLGSVAHGILERAECPVLVIPAKELFSPLKEIVFAAELASEEVQIIKEVAGLARAFEAQITFTYVSNNSKGEVVKFNLFRKSLLKELSEVKFEFKRILSRKVADGLSTEIKLKNAGLLVMISHPGGVLRKAFGGSSIRSMFYRMKIPMLVYHSLGAILQVQLTPSEIML